VKAARVLPAEVTRAAVALLTAAALWLVVGGDERYALWVPVSVTLSPEDARGVAAVPASPVRALVTGRRRDFLHLLRSLPVLDRATSRDGSDSTRLELQPGDVTLPHRMDARVIDLQPRVLVVRYAREPRA